LTCALIVEDSPTQAEQLKFILQTAGFDVVHAEDGRAALEKIVASDFDVVISDIVMPGMSGYELCRKLRDTPNGATVPVILLSTLNEPMDIIRGLECGADNFVTKPYRPEQLINRVKTLIANKGMRANGRLKLGVELLFLGKKFTITSEREQILDLLISTFEDTVRANQTLQKSQSELAAAKAEVQSYVALLEERVRERTAALATVNAELQQEIVVRRRGEGELQRTEKFLNLVIECVPDMLFVKDAQDHRFILLNRAGEELLGYDRSEVIGKEDYDLFPKDEADDFLTRDREVIQSGKLHLTPEESVTTRYRGERVLQTQRMPVFGEDGEPKYVLGHSEDITDRRTMEHQRRQAQRMEAIGNLTGGVAHDFNNMLGIIIGNLDLLEEELKDNKMALELAGEASNAAQRGAELTMQLLAFSRQQPLDSKPVDVNALASRTTRMLGRTLGEQIEVSLTLAEDLWLAIADPAQLEAAIVNLAVNARDAMPAGGKLMIATRNAWLDEDYTSRHAELAPGEYVALEASDTGTGMTPEVMSRIFEPFFTTKAPGKGTGLGLSMVYGFVRQSGGSIDIYSEVGHGTTIRLYFPRAQDGIPSSTEQGASVAVPLARNEIIMVVEDNTGMRRVAARQLRGLGYRIIEAEDARSALDILDRDEPVDLLFTDVVMPGGMTGLELARQATSRRPGLKVLFTSGFSHAVQVNEDTMEGIALLSKPYGRHDLARIVRRILDE
jgi:PAS domain S-box-containing protein